MNTQDSIRERIASVLSDEHTSINQFAKKAGLGTGNLARQLKGTQTITRRTLDKISKAFGISFVWLERGEGERNISHMYKPRTENYKLNEDDAETLRAKLSAAEEQNILLRQQLTLSQEQCRKLIELLAKK